MKRIKAACKAVVIAVGMTTILLIVIVAGGEFWARSTAEKPWGSDAINAQTQTFAYHPWAAFRNTPGFRYQQLGRTYVKINKYGWRGPEPAIDRPKNVKRAILLGDSVTFSGWGCREGVTMGGALTRALELRTAEEWEVINMAVHASFSSMSLATLAHEGMQFKPDVVVSSATNDFLILRPDFAWIYFDQPRHTYRHLLYSKFQDHLQKIYDPRTGRYDDAIVWDQLVAHSELLKRMRRFIRRPGATMQEAPSPEPQRLDPFIDNQLAMSYLATGAGIPFIAVLPPYLSLKHKTIGSDDRAVIDKMNESHPGLLAWIDEVYPVMRERLAAAAAQNPSLVVLDLSLMFTTEQVFVDNAHMRCEADGLAMPGNELIAARMADEIVGRVYQGRELPDWRRTHIEGTPHDWNDRAYLDANPDVAPLVAKGKFASGYEHYLKVGFGAGLHSGFPSWNERQYLADNPDVAAWVESGTYKSGFDHYLKTGRAEGRLKGLRPRWVEGSYLHRHSDVGQAIKRGDFTSGLDHYTRAGAKEGRPGGFSGWDEEGYRFANKDVQREVNRGTFTSGLDHYYQAGMAEGRPARLGTYTPPE